MGTKNIDGALKQYFSQHLLEEPKDQAFFHSQFNPIARAVAERIAKYSKSIGEDSDQFKDRLSDAYDVITSIRYATNEDIHIRSRLSAEQQARRDKREYRWGEHTIWNHGDLQLAFQKDYQSEYARKVEVDILQGEAVKYLLRPWMENQQLEWIMVDALTFATVTSFGEELKQHARGAGFLGLNFAYFSTKGNITKMMWKRSQHRLTVQLAKAAIFFGMPIAVGWYFFNKGYQEWMIVGGVAYGALLTIVLLYKILGRLFPGEPKPQFDKYGDYLDLLGEMWVTYDLLQGTVVSPTLLRERLLDAANKGAVWPGAIFSMLDHAIQRNPAVWGAWDEARYRE